MSAPHATLAGHLWGKEAGASASDERVAAHQHPVPFAAAAVDLRLPERARAAVPYAHNVIAAVMQLAAHAAKSGALRHHGDPHPPAHNMAFHPSCEHDMIDGAQ